MTTPRSQHEQTGHERSDPVEPAPDLRLRARAPSSLRLSRKVVLAGLCTAVSVIALALVNGLGARPDRAPDAVARESHVAASGPPDAIRSAPAQYAASDLARTEPEAAISAEEELAPPADPFWARAAAPAPEPAPRAPTAPSMGPAEPAPILFGAWRAGADRNDGNDTADVDQRSRAAEALALHPGTVIRAALITALNSEAPGPVIAQVTAPVLDSASLEHVLIPQGARLIGAYASNAAYGERRVLISWTSLVFPDGSSVDLSGMQGADPTGAAGLEARTEHRWGQLALSTGLSALISVAAANAEADDKRSVAPGIGGAAAHEAARTGARLVDRELGVRPVHRLPAGAPVIVLVARTLRLRAY